MGREPRARLFLSRAPEATAAGRAMPSGGASRLPGTYSASFPLVLLVKRGDQGRLVRLQRLDELGG